MPRQTRNSLGLRRTDSPISTIRSTAHSLQYIDFMGYGYFTYTSRRRTIFLRCNKRMEYNCSVKARMSTDEISPIVMFPGHTHTHEPPYAELIYHSMEFRNAQLPEDDSDAYIEVIRPPATRYIRVYSDELRRSPRTRAPTHLHVWNANDGNVNDQPPQAYERCTICFDNMAIVTLLTCKHRFCNTCVTELIHNNFDTCPLCRQIIVAYEGYNPLI